MIPTVFQDSAAGVAVRYAPFLRLGQPWPRRRLLRRRRKIPSWVGLALLVLFIDMAMAVLAWVAVDVVLH
ncbi:hypothetical protein TM239_50290 [Bradyrhizobium sp. TM239]|nr:hypothetical protein TM233_35430 [Bradyrhizobium sp. TM233]GMP07958.1 hypothetical protein TM239_50290 [Bradyrhizobium sp. TM239]